MFKKITRIEYNSIHPDYKGLWKDWIYRILVLKNWITQSIPVLINNYK